MDGHWLFYGLIKMKTKTKNNNIIKKLKHNSLTLGLIIFFGIAWSWVFFTDLLELAGSKIQGLILAIIISAIIIGLSVVILRLGIKINKGVYKKYNFITATLFALAVFALADFLVAWLTALFWIGPEGRLDSILPLSSPALIAINTPFAYASRLIGFYGLASFVWLVVFLLFTKRYKIALSVTILLSAISMAGWYPYKNTSGSTFTANVISEALDNRINPVNVSADDVSLTVFPEYGLDKITNESLSDRIYSKDNKKHFFIGSEQVIPSDKVGHYNRLLFGNTTDGYTNKQNKYRLIPGGEDLPYILRLGLRATNQKNTLDYFSYAKGTLKGPHQLTPFRIDGGTVVGSAVCSSIISPEDYRHFAKNGSTIFTNSASLSIFQGSSVFSYQQKSLAKFMAVANSRYFLQSANKARAFILDNNGKTLAEGIDQKLLTNTVANNTTKTPYSLVGEWMVVAGAIAVTYIIIKGKLSPNKSSRRKNKNSKKA
jgi:hypothetical protein